MMSDNTRMWMAERARHPFFGENIGQERYGKIWDDAAEKYDDAGVGSLKEDVLYRLIDIGMIADGLDVMDVGCGPGTYSILFAGRCRSVLCLDGSQPMLDRISGKGISNIRCVRADWNDYRTEERFDTVFSSLCPALNCPEALIRMERFSRDGCAYVSSMNDDRDSIHMEIWRGLGRDYTYNGYDTRYPFGFLKESGRDPVLDVFERRLPYDLPKDEVIRRETDSFSFFMPITDDVRSVIKDVVERHSDGDTVHYDGKKRLGLLTWKVP